MDKQVKRVGCIILAAGKGMIDEVIEPKFTRYKVIKALEMLRNKRDDNPPKKHGNIPL